MLLQDVLKQRIAFMHYLNFKIYKLFILDNQSASPEQYERAFTFFIDSKRFQTQKSEALKRSEGRKLRHDNLNTLWVGYRQLNQVEVSQLPMSEIPHPYPYKDQINTTITYRGFETSCNFLERNSTEWSTAGCVVSQVNCLSPLNYNSLSNSRLKAGTRGKAVVVFV